MFHLNQNASSIVDAATEMKFSTNALQCNPDPNYNSYECIESYFYQLRGCQYPWNVYSNLNVPICTNFSEVKDMIKSYDRNMGYRRERFTPFEQITRTNGTCLPPCKSTLYRTRFQKWDISGEGRSFQIAFPDFSIVSETEYVKCGYACIIGELGGNLGFFLGGSLLFVIDLVIHYVAMLAKIVLLRFHANV